MRVDYHTQDGRDTHWDTKYSGVRNILYERYTETTNDNTRARLERYIREEPCTACHGARLRPEMLAVTVGGKSIYDVCRLSCRESLEFFEGLELSERQQFIGGRIVKEILRAPALFGRRWPGLPYPGPCLRHAFRRRGAAHPPGDPDWRGTHGRALYLGRAFHRPAPAR